MMAVVGTLNWVDTAASLCKLGGIEAKAYKLHKYSQAFKFILSKEFRNSDAIYQVGAGGIKYLIIAKLFRKPLIKHWIGTDAYCIANGSGWKHRFKLNVFKKYAALHLADSPEVNQQLEEVGIHCKVVRLLPPEMLGEILPLPDKFTVLGYWFDENIEIYGGEHILRLAKDFPHINFLVVGATGKGIEASPNITFLGYQKNLNDIFPKVSVFVRLPSHDSISALALEMLSRGRYVIYSHPLPGSIQVNNYEEARQALKKLIDKKQPNTEAPELIRKEFNPDVQADNIGILIRNCLLNKQ